MNNPGHWTQIMWGVLCASWVFAAILRSILVYLSWPHQRKRRTFSVFVCAGQAVYFLWKMLFTLPGDVDHSDILRNIANTLLVVWMVLDGIWGIQGMAERRAKNISEARDKGLPGCRKREVIK